MRFRFPSRGDPTPAMEPLEPRLLLDGTPLITEFMADNDETLLDKFGESSDWIEIYNPTTEPINLDGWHLTDDPDETRNLAHDPDGAEVRRRLRDTLLEAIILQDHPHTPRSLYQLGVH